MKKYIFILLVFWLHQSFAQESKEIIVTSQIKKITGLFEGYRITREKKITVPKGESTIRFTGLSLYIKPESIKVSASGNLQILSVKHEQNFHYQTVQPAGEIVVKISSDKVYQSTFKIIYAIYQANQFESEDPYKYETNLSNRIPYLKPVFLEHHKPGSIIKGTVTDEVFGEPFPGVSVVVKGTSIEVFTDFDGKYFIKLPDTDAHILVFSSVGYKTLEIPVNTTEINVTMKESKQQLNTMVVELRDPVPLVSRQKTKIKTQTILEKVVVNDEKPQNKKQSQTDEQLHNKQPQKSLQSQNNAKQSSINYIIKESVNFPNYIKSIVPVIIFNTFTNYEYVAVPKKESKAYLTADVKSWKKYNIVFNRHNTYIDSTRLDTNISDTGSSKNHFRVILGVDKDVKTERKLIKKTSRKNLWNNIYTDKRKWRIVVKNNKDIPVFIEVRDQIPVSKSNEIRVKVKNLSGGKLNPETGEVVWHLHLAPGKKKELILYYAVKHPKYDDLVIE